MKPSTSRILIFLFFCLIYGGYWRSYAIFTDEKASVFIANGIPTDNFAEGGGFLAERYDTITPAEIAAENKVSTVYHNAIRDGGNGQLYYFIAHYTSLSLGRYIGVFNSLKLLSVIFSLIMVMAFHSFIRKFLSEKKAIIASLVLIAVTVKFNIYIRNYAMSNMLLMFFFIALFSFYESLTLKKEIKIKQYILIFVIGTTLPFVHFFNALYVGFAGLPLLFFIAQRRAISKEIVFAGLSLSAAMAIFLSYYFFLNAEGRAYQSLINQYWKLSASLFGYGSNYWMPPFTLKYAVTENEELLLRLTGLDLRDAVRSIRLIFLLFTLAVPAILIFKLLKAKLTNEVEVFHLKTVQFCLLVCVIYIGFLNFIYYSTGHATALNSQWYSSGLYVPFIFILAMVLKFTEAKNLRVLLYSYVFVVLLNSGIGAKTVVNRDVQSEKITLLLDKIENQF